MREGEVLKLGMDGSDGAENEMGEVEEWGGKIVHIFTSPGHDYWGRAGAGRLQNGIMAPDEVECVAGKGLVGDRYFGKRVNAKGQVTFFDMDVVEAVRGEFKLPKLPASIFRRNVVVRGVDLRSFLGRRFRVQGVVFEGSQECKPCHWMDRVIDAGAEGFLGQKFRGGLRARVITSGVLRLG